MIMGYFFSLDRGAWLIVDHRNIVKWLYVCYCQQRSDEDFKDMLWNFADKL
jgi:hypothetical protein